MALLVDALDGEGGVVADVQCFLDLREGSSESGRAYSPKVYWKMKD